MAVKKRTAIWSFEGGRLKPRRDQLAEEEPLQIRLRAGGVSRNLAVTMRSPGADFELAAGLLFSEGLISGRTDITRISYCSDVPLEERYNTVTVTLNRATLPEPGPAERRLTMTAACGVCGRDGIDDLLCRIVPLEQRGPCIPAELLLTLPTHLRTEQGVFSKTGGVHAAALFDLEGRLLALREDVGRHNALDKLIGRALLDGELPLRERIVLLSGRAGFELVQKCALAGVPLLCAVSAPSSLAVATAQAAGLTLVGFLREGRFNVYSGVERIVVAEA